MKHRSTSFCVLLVLLFLGLNSLMAQTSLVYSEDFENGAGSFLLNTSNSVGSNSGSNKWIVNNAYQGMPLYPNTISQDSTVGGLINFAPFSKYLHIHDSIAASSQNIANANFNPLAASDRFVETINFCTLGLDSVRIAFYYNCVGSTNASAQLYYSAENGPWIPVPAAVFNNTPKWKYAEISNPGFNNRNDIRFGFRWKNEVGTFPATGSFGVDGVRIVGHYAPNVYNVRIELDSISPNPVCRGQGVQISFKNPTPLCGLGFYEIQLSNLFGQFTNYSSLGIYQLNNEDPSHLLFTLPTPSNLNISDCYKIRVVRVDITPMIVSDTSDCISIINCPNQVWTLEPPVISNPSDTVCVGSVIDIPFYSEGVFLNNTYVAQLSDSNGNFPPNPNVLGSIPDNNSYPYGTMPKGNVPGLIRVQNHPIPPGCNYFIRVIAINPSTTGDLYGPFCIRECDIETNEKQDVQFCLTDVTGGDTLLNVAIKQYELPADYSPPNEFQLQVLDFNSFTVINTGVVGNVEAINDTTVEITIPPLPQLFSVGLIPGVYYLRVVATNSNQPWDVSGTLIRLTIGAPNPTPLLIDVMDVNTFQLLGYTGDTTICLNDALYFYLMPFNPNSSYVWSLNNNPNFYEGGPYNPILFNSGGHYTMTVTETNFGCVGPGSNLAEIDVAGAPSSNILGPFQLCEGDTANYHVPLSEDTYYSWGINPGSIVDTLGNNAEIYFPTAGPATISLLAVNQCGNVSSTKLVQVRPPPIVNAGNDTTICKDSEVLLTTNSGNGYSYYWSLNDEVFSQNQSATVSPDSSSTYIIKVTNSGSLKCETSDTVTVNVKYIISGNLTIV